MADLRSLGIYDLIIFIDMLDVCSSCVCISLYIYRLFCMHIDKHIYIPYTKYQIESSEGTSLNLHCFLEIEVNLIHVRKAIVLRKMFTSLLFCHCESCQYKVGILAMENARLAFLIKKMIRIHIGFIGSMSGMFC